MPGEIRSVRSDNHKSERDTPTVTSTHLTLVVPLVCLVIWIVAIVGTSPLVLV